MYSNVNLAQLAVAICHYPMLMELGYLLTLGRAHIVTAVTDANKTEVEC